MKNVSLITLIFTFISSAMVLNAELSKPNIVFFFADDLGYSDLGCYGHPYAKTPHLDKLASQGTRFSQFYVTGVTCNPSRTGLMTGVHPARNKKYASYFGFGERESITNILKQNGYTTGHFGKWHIGPVEDNGTYGIDKIQTIGKSKDKTNGRDDDLTSAAIEFIKENSKKPFYVNIWGHSTHYPVTSAPKHAAKFIEQKVKRSDFSKSMQHKFDSSAKLDPNLDKSMHQYLGDVYSLDANVGRVMNAIEQLGIADNTIFVFSSDHGPAPVVLNKDKVMEYSKNMLGYAGIFKGGKHEQTEGGVRVPFIVRWPGKIKANRLEANSVVSFIDWLPTLCSIVGIEKLPPNLDGEDISDIWFGESRERKTDLYWKTSSTGGVASMRQGNWKFHMGTKKKAKVLELYDLSQDPSESQNVAGKYPDITAKLTKQISSWVDELPETYEKLEKKKKKNKKKK